MIGMLSEPPGAFVSFLSVCALVGVCGSVCLVRSVCLSSVCLSVSVARCFSQVVEKIFDKRWQLSFSPREDTWHTFWVLNLFFRSSFLNVGLNKLLITLYFISLFISVPERTNKKKLGQMIGIGSNRFCWKLGQIGWEWEDPIGWDRLGWEKTGWHRILWIGSCLVG